jgi:hypothetical protein
MSSEMEGGIAESNGVVKQDKNEEYMYLRE